MGGVSGGMRGAPTHMYAHVHPPTHVKHANKHDTHEGSHLQFLYMYILGQLHVHVCVCVCACVCVYMHACMHVCGGIPYAPRYPKTTCPSPRAGEAQITKNAIKLE